MAKMLKAGRKECSLRIFCGPHFLIKHGIMKQLVKELPDDDDTFNYLTSKSPRTIGSEDNGRKFN